MRFDFESTCAHPRIVQRLMKEFAEDVFNGKKAIIMRKGHNGFCTFAPPEDPSEIKIGYDFESLGLKDIGNMAFNTHFHDLASFTKGFSCVTLSLLHEIGHQKTFHEISSSYDRNIEIDKIIRKPISPKEQNMEYFNLEDEALATKWAIRWLKNADHRKMAKSFERAFFKAWRG